MLKQLAGANPDYAAAIELAKTTVETPWRVTVKGATAMSKEAAKQPSYLDEILHGSACGSPRASRAITARTRKAPAAALRLYGARELGLTPMAAAELTVIKGRLYVGAQLLRALAIRAGYRVFRLDASDESCTARIVANDGRIVGESTFALEQATKAGLVRSGSPWTTHPGRMLWARASKNAIVDFAPEVAQVGDGARRRAPGDRAAAPTGSG